MRIAYIIMHVEKLNMLGGVGRKIELQTSQWRQAGHEVKPFILMSGLVGENIYTYKTYTLLPFISDLTRMASRSYALSRLIDNVKEYQPDIIYLRCGRYVFPLHVLAKVAPIILEINAMDIGEHRLRGGYYYWSHLFSRRILFGNMSGFVAVSHEIAQAPENNRYRKPIRMIANGIEVRRDMFLPAPSNPKPVLVMVASPGMIWHGVEKLLYLARQYPDLTIHVAGYGPEDLPDSAPQNLVLHGFLPREQVKEILKFSDVAFGTLAAHLKNMEEVPSLKAREAAAYGIPLILGCRDADLSDLQTDCILQIPNVEDNVQTHAAQIRDFAYRMQGRRLDFELIESRIGHRQKEEARLAFFEEILAQR